MKNDKNYAKEVIRMRINKAIKRTHPRWYVTLHNEKRLYDIMLKLI